MLRANFGPESSGAVVCGLALRKADGDDTVQWPQRRSATRNDSVPAQLVLHPHSPLTGHQPAELCPLARPVNAVICLWPVSNIFQTKCRMVVVQDDTMLLDRCRLTGAS